MPDLSKEVDLFLKEKTRKDCSSKTIKNYKFYLTKLDAWFQDKELNTENIRKFLDKSFSKKKTQRDQVILFKQFMKFIDRPDIMSKIEIPKNRRKEIKLVDLIYLEKLIAGGDSLDRAMLSLFVSSGLRISEFIDAKIMDADFENKTIRVWGKGLKRSSGEKPTTAVFSDECAEYIKEYLGERSKNKDEFIFLNPRTKKSGHIRV